MLNHLTDERLQELKKASPEKTLTIFYDQVMDCFYQAISAIARNAIAERCNATTAAIELLAGMIEWMDAEEGDEIGQNIRSIHSFIITRLPAVNLYNDARFLAEAVRLVKPLRDAFAVVDRQAEEIRRNPAGVQSELAALRGRPRLSLVHQG